MLGKELEAANARVGGRGDEESPGLISSETRRGEKSKITNIRLSSNAALRGAAQLKWDIATRARQKSSTVWKPARKCFHPSNEIKNGVRIEGRLAMNRRSLTEQEAESNLVLAVLVKE
jgi:hypothetical protein